MHSNNRFLTAFNKLLYFSAVIHVIFLIVYSLINQTILPFNYFDILDLDLFFPNINQGSMSQLLLAGLAVLVFLIIYLKFTQNKQKYNSDK